MAVIIVLSIVIAVAGLLLVSQMARVTKMKQLLADEQERCLRMEKKIESSQADFKKNSSELERRRTELQEARELLKKKDKQKALALQNVNLTGDTTMSDQKTLEENQRTIAALESTIEEMKRQNAEEIKMVKTGMNNEADKEIERKDDEVAKLKKELADAQEEIKRQKKLMRPQGVKIDLKTLPDEAASEFSRVYRKAENHEKLHGIARAKLHLAQEKFATLQKRYFAVCRELALHMGQDKEIEPNKAREIAEEMIADKVTQDHPVHVAEGQTKGSDENHNA